MKQKLLKLKALMVVLMMAVGFGQAFAEDVTGTITFNKDAVKINAASVTGDDDLNNTWQITTVGTTSYTANSAYYQVGSSSKPATSITFTTTLPAEQTITSMSAKFGGFNGTAGTITLKVGDTTIGTGSLSATSDVVVSNSSQATGTVLTITVTGIAKGVKVYYVSYTYSEGGSVKTPTTTTFNGESSYDVELGEEFVGPTATVSDGTSVIGGASVTYSSTDEAVATVDATTGAVALVGAGTTTIKATYAGDDTYAPSSASYTLNVTLPVPSFASLEEVAASGLASGTKVKVSFENAVIKNIYKTKAGERRGLYFDIKGPNDEDIEIYYGSAMPDEWEVGGTVSGTAVEFTWTLFGSTWELILKNGWGDLSYQAPAQPETANMRISAAGWATFWAPFAVEIPAGVKAYTGEMQKGWIRMNEQTKGYIPANTGVVLELVEGEPFETELSPMSPQPNEAAVESCYTGNESGAIMDVAVGNYLLQKNFDDEKKEDVVGWYRFLARASHWLQTVAT